MLFRSQYDAPAQETKGFTLGLAGEDFGLVSKKISQVGQQLRGVHEIFSTMRENMNSVMAGLEDGLLLFTRDARAVMISPAAEKFLGDHFDSFAGKVDYNERTLCGHVDGSPRGMGTWQPPYAPAGAVQNKVADAASAERMSLNALLGHACGRNFKAAEHLAKHPDFAWQKDMLRDMNSRGWTKFTAK